MRIATALMALQFGSPVSQALSQRRLHSQNEDGSVPCLNKVRIQTEEVPGPIDRCLEQYFEAALGDLFGQIPFVRSQQNEDGSDPNTAALERCIKEVLQEILESP